ncbi:MAG: hypothetical protein WAL67_03010 [Candidatus Cybelea sp.]
MVAVGDRPARRVDLRGVAQGTGSKGVAFSLPIDFRRDRAGGYNVYDFAGTIQRLSLE